MRWLLCALVGLMGLMAGVPAHAQLNARSHNIYPEQQIPVRFPHQRHLENGLVCEVCHSMVLGSTQASDRNLPGHQLCGACHRAEQPEAEMMFPKSGCQDCHPGWTEGSHTQIGPDLLPLPDGPKPPALVMPPARLTFSHKLHLDQGAVCLDCHPGIPTAEEGTVEHLPTMYDCLACHDGRRAPDECATCHLQDMGTGRLLTDLFGTDPLAPIGLYRPDDHSDPEWIRRHEFAARADQDQCSACHAPSVCLACHDGVQKDQRLHPGDWQMTHGLEAQRRTLECRACHDAESFCSDCHQRTAVRRGDFPGVTGDPAGTLAFHPEGWEGVLGEIAGPEHHSHVARRSLETCATCHTEDSCVECHSFVNPHGDRYSDPKDWGYGQGSGMVCSRCHQPGDPNLAGIQNGR